MIFCLRDAHLVMKLNSPDYFQNRRNNLNEIEKKFSCLQFEEYLLKHPDNIEVAKLWNTYKACNGLTFLFTSSLFQSILSRFIAVKEWTRVQKVFSDFLCYKKEP